MTASLVLRESREPHIARLTLNDPQARNAMSEAMAVEFRRAIEELRRDASVRVVILSGAGSAFSGGGHLEMLFEKTTVTEAENRQRMEQFYDDFLSLRSLEVPVIAAINGHAIGAGLCLALACDVRIAAEGAKLGLNFVHLALHPGMGATYFLPRLVGPARAAELLYAGRIVTAAEAAEIGMVNRTVAADALSGEVDALAKTIAGAGPQAIRELKATLRTALDLDIDDALRREAHCQALDYAGPEFLEGINAAREKRKPVF